MSESFESAESSGSSARTPLLEHRPVDTSMLFFDLVFVFAVTFLKITNTDISGNDEARRKRNERKLPVSAFFKRSGSSSPASQTDTERSQQA